MLLRPWTLRADRDGHSRTGWERFARPVLAICLLAGACHGPTLTARTDPRGERLFVDGRLHPEGEPIPFRYYGKVRLQVEPRVREGSEFRYLGLERLVEVNEPITPWLFPLDFFLEAMLRPFHGGGERSVELALRENPSEVVAGLEPQGAEDVRARSAQARTRR